MWWQDKGNHEVRAFVEDDWRECLWGMDLGAKMNGKQPWGVELLTKMQKTRRLGFEDEIVSCSL
jgi:hypothetical protein